MSRCKKGESVTMNAAKQMLGNGFYSTNGISKLMGLTIREARNVMLILRNTQTYHTGEKKVNGKVFIEVLGINEEQKVLSSSAKLWRLAIFGERA